MRVTEDELVLAAHYGFNRRLSEVVAATLAYQRDKRTHDRCLDEVDEAETVLDTARRLSDRLPSGLGLLQLAEAQDARSRRELARASDRMRASAGLFVEVVGRAAPDVVAAMDEHGWALDRPKLLAALRARAGLALQ